MPLLLGFIVQLHSLTTLYLGATTWNRIQHDQPKVPQATFKNLKDKFVVRLPDGLRPRIAEVAKRYHRSMNSEIIQILEKHLLKPDENKSLDDQLITLISKLSDKQKRAVLTLFGFN